MSKWSKQFWVDLAERAGSTALYGLVTVLSIENLLTGGLTAEVAWTVVGLPTALAVVKGLMANLKDPDSGASLVNHPPGPIVQ